MNSFFKYEVCRVIVNYKILFFTLHALFHCEHLSRFNKVVLNFYTCNNNIKEIYENSWRSFMQRFSNIRKLRNIGVENYTSIVTGTENVRTLQLNNRQTNENNRIVFLFIKNVADEFFKKMQEFNCTLYCSISN
jgi:hypothetical protein